MNMLKAVLQDQNEELRGNETRPELLHRYYQLVRTDEQQDYSHVDFNGGDAHAVIVGASEDSEDSAEFDIHVEADNEAEDFNGEDGDVVLYPDPDDAKIELDNDLEADDEVEEDIDELFEQPIAQDIFGADDHFVAHLAAFQEKKSHNDDELFVFREYFNELSMAHLRANVKARLMRCTRTKLGLIQLLVCHLNSKFDLSDEEYY